MFKKIGSAFAAMVLMPSAFAQEPNPYVGTWEAEFQSQNGGRLGGKVVITDQGGTWDLETNARSHRNPCAGRLAPIAIQRATPDELLIRVRNSEVLAGCNDYPASFQRIDANTLEGQFGSGRTIRLSRR